MPSSGSFTATYGGHPFTLQLNWSVASQNVATNQSTINWSLYTIKTGSFTPYRTDGAATWAFNYVGSGNWGPYNFNGSVGQSILMASGSFTVTHAADGTYTLSTSFSANADSTITTASGSGSAALPTIPRATQPTVSPVSGNTDSTYTIDVSTAASSSFYHDFYYSLDGGSTYTSLFSNIPATTTSENWTPASSLLPNASGVTAIIRVDTRSSSGGTVIGTKTVSLPLTVPSSIVPTISAVSFVDTQVSAPNMPSLMGGAGRFVQGWSILEPTATATGASGSTITDDEITMVGQTTPSGTAFGLPVNSSGAVPYSAIATDSRSRNSVPFTGTCTVKAYNFPSLPTPTVQRTSDAAGLIPAPTGTYIAVTPAASVSDLTFSGTQYNNLEYQIRTQPDTGGAWTTVTAWTSAAAVTWTTKQILAGYSASQGWNIEISIRDIFGHNGYNTGNTVKVLTIHVPSESVFMDMDEGVGLGILKYRDQIAGLALDVGGNIHQNGNAVLDASEIAANSDAVTGTSASLLVTPASLTAVVPLAIANLASLPATTGFRNGTLIYVISMNCNFMVDSGVWIQQGVSTFDTTAHRDTEYARASSAYLVQGAMSQCANDKYQTRIYFTAYNASTNAQSPTTAAGWVTQSPTNRFRMAWQGGTFAATANLGSPTSIDDPSSGWDATNKRWTAKFGGEYHINLTYKQNGSGTAGWYVFKGTSSPVKIYQSENAAASAYSSAKVNDYIVLLPGDVLAIQVAGGVTLQSDAPADNTYWSMEQVSY